MGVICSVGNPFDSASEGEPVGAETKTAIIEFPIPNGRVDPLPKDEHGGHVVPKSDNHLTRQRELALRPRCSWRRLPPITRTVISAGLSCVVFGVVMTAYNFLVDRGGWPWPKRPFRVGLVAGLFIAAIGVIAIAVGVVQ